VKRGGTLLRVHYVIAASCKTRITFSGDLPRESRRKRRRR
jgi:hypothetical protein